MRIPRRTFLSTAAFAAAPTFARHRHDVMADPIDWHALADEVRAEMRWAWQQYRLHAWGKDQIRPVSGGYESFALKDRHLGLSLIEALDTLWVMGLDAEFEEGVAWVKANLDFALDGELSVFETSIRLVGGLLSAWHACGDETLLHLAHDLGTRLLPAFEETATGLPYRFVNLATGAVRDPVTNPAETGTYLPEYGTLGRAMGDPRFEAAAKRAAMAMFDRRSSIGLLADAMDARTGQWLSRRATVGPPSDSYYEYLWDGWQLFGDADCKRMYDACTAAILAYQPRRADGHLWFVDVDFETGAQLSTEQDELASFYGGLLAQGGAGAIGAAYTEA